MKKEGENINFSTPTEYLVLLQAIFIGAGFVAGVLYLIFAEPKASNFIFAVYFIYVLLLIIGVVGLCKEFVDFIHRMLKVEELTKYRNDYLIAFGAMGVFFVVLRVFVYFSKFSEELINVDGGRKEVTKQSVESKKVETKSIPEPEPQSKPASSKPSCNCSTPRISVTTTPTCKICSAPYTENGIHTPRIIKECGHSVCEQCADNLLKLKTENFITCPFCQKVTIVHGSAETLPKNFALLEQIESVQKIPMMSVKPNILY
ncbi:hypothetical protein CAEBREN_09415 [Caenorhabditis brenneri]|uniref:RING-type domain-containing protein n=1 Tax=Caenorhabditis brenneri TaxID=135651 RepID=G0MWU8_CAEBE|nr:hypothetical protein CAEBREN_09415 [Caenorhabditis brenneri]